VKRAISPVIATVIIVAVTIAIAIAVALWMSGLVGSFTATENIQIISAYAVKGNETTWTINMTVKNVGTTDATIDNIFINGKPYDSYTNPQIKLVNPTDTTKTISLPLSLPAGGTIPIAINITNQQNAQSGNFTSGQMVEIKLHTASGKEYPKQVTLP